jgi:hypothetical protein
VSRTCSPWAGVNAGVTNYLSDPLQEGVMQDLVVHDRRIAGVDALDQTVG